MHWFKSQLYLSHGGKISARDHLGNWVSHFLDHSTRKYNNFMILLKGEAPGLSQFCVQYQNLRQVTLEAIQRENLQSGVKTTK